MSNFCDYEYEIRVGYFTSSYTEEEKRSYTVHVYANDRQAAFKKAEKLFYENNSDLERGKLAFWIITCEDPKPL